MYKDIIRIYFGLHKVLRGNTKYRKFFFVFTLAGFLIFASLAIFAQYFLGESWNSQIQLALAIMASTLGLGFLLVTISFVEIDYEMLDNLFDISNIRKERKEILGSDENADSISIRERITLSLNKLTEYYAVNINQARTSFFFSIGALVVGFGTIVAAVWLYLSNPTSNITVSVISGISGLIVQTIAGTYLFVYNRSIIQINLFYAQLNKIQDVMLAVEIAEDIIDPKTKEQMYIEIVQSLISKKSTT